MDNLHLSDDDNGVTTSGIIGLIWSMNTCVVAWCFVTSHSSQGTYVTYALRKKCPYSELFWSVFSHIWTESGEIRSISPYSIRMRENADQNNSEHGHFSRSDSDMLTGNLFTMARRVPVEGWTRDHNDTGVCGTN